MKHLEKQKVKYFLISASYFGAQAALHVTHILVLWVNIAQNTLAGTEHFAVQYIASSSNLPTLSETGLQKGQGLCKPDLNMGISGCSQLGQGYPPGGVKISQISILNSWQL